MLEELIEAKYGDDTPSPSLSYYAERLKPKRAILTHMHIDLDYAALRGELPPGVEPAYDGMVLETE